IHTLDAGLVGDIDGLNTTGCVSNPTAASNFYLPLALVHFVMTGTSVRRNQLWKHEFAFT
ncbi:MAG: hypothetical protein ACKORJ_03445, partial [Bacteroidota bacterium]